MPPNELEFWKTKLATAEQLAKLNRIATVVGDDPSMPPHSAPRQRDSAPLAQLTATGVDHMCGKGVALRARYDAFIKSSGIDDAPHESVYVLSSNIDRTIQSVQCLLYGMFHNDEEIQQREAKHEAVFYIRTHAKNHLAPAHPISVFGELETLLKDEIAKRDRQKTEQLGNRLREIVGVPEDQNVPWTAIRDTLTCRKAHDLPLPEGITDEIYDEVCEYDAWLWHQMYNRADFCFNTFENGTREVYKLLKAVTDKSTDKKFKMSFFSAHDNSVVALISALQIKVGHVLPEYGTIITVEIYEAANSGKFYVKVLFDGKPVPFEGHEHSALCPYEHVDQLTKKFLRE